MVPVTALLPSTRERPNRVQISHLKALDNDVMVRAAVDDIVVVAAIERIVTIAAPNRVRAGSAAHIIVSAQSPNLIVSVLGRDRVAAVRAGDSVIPGCAPDAAHKVIHVSLPSVVLPWFIPRGCGGYQL